MARYTIADFKRLGVYQEAPAHSDVGEIKKGAPWQDVPPAIRKRLASVGGGKHNDPSREDAGVITDLLRHRSPEDVYATFDASARGKDARRRKESHYDDYMQRTMRAQVAFLAAQKKKEEGFSVTIKDKNDGIEAAEPGATADNWREFFRTPAEYLNLPELDFVVDQFIVEEGVTGLGGLSGHGKTLLAISLAKCIARNLTKEEKKSGEGKMWLGKIETKTYPVMYIIPESGARSFARRLKAFRITQDTDRFLIRTMSDGYTLPLSGDAMKAAVKGRVIFLDTFRRFLEGKSEQKSEDMGALGDIIRELIKAGAVSVVFLHHSPKATRGELIMDLENVFSGSGDIGANLDSGHGLRMLDSRKVIVQVQNVKARDHEALEPFQVQARPHLDSTGDLYLLKEPGLCGDLAKEKKTKGQNETATKIKKYLQENGGRAAAQRVKMSGRTLYALVGGSKKTFDKVLAEGMVRKWWLTDHTGRDTDYRLYENETK